MVEIRNHSGILIFTHNGANLIGANLSGANLIEANLSWAVGILGKIIDGGIRSDGHRFLLTKTEPGSWRVRAGCRDLSLDDAYLHWNDSRPDGDKIKEETLAIIEHMVKIAKIRGWE